MGLYLIARFIAVMKMRPASGYVFELLLALDLYQLLMGLFVFCAVLREAWALGLLLRFEIIESF